MSGAWEFANMTPCNLPQRAASAFTKATESFAGNHLEPVLYIGSQVVAGTNYCIICKSTLVTNPPVAGCQIVYIYEDLDGKCTITRIEDIIR